MNAITDSPSSFDGTTEGPPERTEEELAAADAAYELELIRLLFKLEHERERIHSAEPVRSVQVLEAVRRMAHELIEFADAQVLTVRLPGDEMSRAMTAVNELFTAVEKAAAEMAGSKKRTEGAAGAFRQGMEILPEVVQSYLALFTGCFPSLRASRAWVEVAATFLVDLRKVAQNLAKPIEATA